MSKKKAGSKAAAKAAVDAGLHYRALTPADFGNVENLFGERGACGGCWCMVWRSEQTGKAFDAQKGEPNRLALKALVEAGRVHAVLAFAGDEAVGWCSFGPRESFPKIARSPSLVRDYGPGVWSVVCFFIRKEWRGQGVGTAMLNLAAELACEAGAIELEGFPAAPTPAYPKLPAAFAWTGVPAMFEAAGFSRVTANRAANARPIYCRRLTAD